MEHFHLLARPMLRSPILIAAFAGWNDAAQSATSAVRSLLRHWQAEKLGEIDPEIFFDFTQTRPTVHVADGIARKIEWPAIELFHHRDGDRPHDFMLLLGVEPQLRWRTFLDELLAPCRELGMAGVVSLGAMLAEAPHTRPVKMTGLCNNADWNARIRRLDVSPTDYEGPTGIVGVLNATAGALGLPTASLWGTVPAYLSAIPNPKVTLAILRRLDGLFALGLDLRELEEMTRRFDRQVADVMAKNPKIARYVRDLEGRGQPAPGAEPPPSATELPSASAVVEDIEEFLKRLRHGDQ